jgi:RNA polymerase sigma-70 factor (ECF subfamily)
MNGQPALAYYILEPGADRFRLGAINVLSLRAGRIVEIAGFLDPDLHRHLGLPADLPEGDPLPDR